MTEPLRQPDEDHGRLRLLNRRDQIEAVERRILSAAARHGFPAASAFALRLALEEALTNAFKHGHMGIPDEPVDLEWSIDPRRAEIVVEDHGPGFRPESVPDPTLDENLERPTGRGIMLMRAYMTDVRFSPSGNRVTMVYDRDAQEARRRDDD
jgi:serine/threonine-protein kinase RsbW